jgi:hypothetical protein
MHWHPGRWPLFHRHVTFDLVAPAEEMRQGGRHVLRSGIVA